MSALKRPDVAKLKTWFDRKYQQAKDNVTTAAMHIKKRFTRTKKGRAVDSSKRLAQYANLSKRNSGKGRGRGRREQKRRRKAEYLASLPKHPLKRFLYRLHPKRFAQYWFSREGAIMALKLAGIGFAVGFVTIIAVFAYFRRDLRNPRDLEFEQATLVYDRTGETVLFSVYGTENRTIVEFDQISEYAKEATIALEDKNFYQHGGFSVSGIARAALNNLLSRDSTGQGGSTITQQFIKNKLVGDEQTYTRKLKELILAIELERNYTKDEILGFYLNQIPYGSLEYGIESASRGFFDKSAKDLTIDEAALLAALPQAPSFYSPYGENTDALVARQHIAIDAMRDEGYITPEEADAAKAVDTLSKIIPLGERSQYRNAIAPHFVDEVLSQVRENYGEALLQTGGLRIITTLDIDQQKIVEKAMKDNFQFVQNPRNGIGQGGDNAAVSVTDVETGQVLAQIGSRDYSHPGYGSFNAATAGRQPGSSFKPFAYSQMFYNERWSPGSIIWDSPVTNRTFNGYRPNNFDFAFRGPMKVRDALGESRNIPAVKALYIAGVDETVELARAMGNTSLNAEGAFLSLVLGAGEVHLAEHTHAYSTFARGGVHKPQTYILKIENSSGEVLEEWRDTPGEQVLDEQVAYLMNHTLTDDVARAGTFGRNNQNLTVPGLVHAVKTGTTDLSRDGWMMGYTTCLSVGVWAGNHDNKPMNTITSWQTGPIFTQVMREAHDLKGCGTEQFPRPEGIKNVRIDRATGRNATDSTQNVINDIAASWFTGVGSEDGDEVVIDSISNKLATECTPELAKKTVANTGIAPELEPDDPLFAAWAETAGYKASASGITEKDDVHSCDDDKPEVTNLNISGNDGIYQFEASYSEGDFDIETVNFKVNGQIVSSCSVPSSSCSDSFASFEYLSSVNGNATVVVEVIDEVLYSDDATENRNFSQYSGGSVTITSPTSGDGNACGGGGFTVDCDVEWQSVPSAQTYEICYWRVATPQDVDCENSNNEQETVTMVNNIEYTVRVTAKRNNGTVLGTGQVTFTA